MEGLKPDEAFSAEEKQSPPLSCEHFCIEILGDSAQKQYNMMQNVLQDNESLLQIDENS